MYLRHEAKLEQSERRAFYLINLIILLAFKIHLTETHHKVVL